MPKRKYLIELLAALRLLAKGRIPYESKGLCFNLYHGFSISTSTALTIMEEACEGWKYYSSNRLYPIEHPSFTPVTGFNYEKEMWHGEYGRRRYELVDRMIDVCIKHIDSPSSKLSVLK